MPKIPSIGENQRIQQGSPGNITGSGRARLAGDNIANLGKGLGNLGMAIGMMEKTKNNLLLQETQTAAKDAAQEALLFAQKNPNAAPDGSSMRADFKSRYEEILGPRLDGANPGMKRQLKSIIDKVGVASRGTLVLNELSMFNENTKIDAERATESMTARNNKEPEKFLENFLDLQKTVELLPWTPLQKKKYMDTVRPQVVSSTVDGFMRKNDFKSAREFMSSDVSKLLSDKERTAQLNNIETVEEGRIDRKFRMDERIRVQTARVKKETQETNFQELMLSKARSTNERGGRDENGELLPLGKDNPLSVELIDQKSDDLFKGGALSATQWKALQMPDSRVTSDEDDRTLGKYVTRIYDTKTNLETLAQDLTADRAAGLVRSGTYDRIMGMIKSTQSGRKSLDPIVSKMLTDKKAALKTIIGKGSRQGPFGPVLNATQATTLERAQSRLTRAARNGEDALNKAYVGILAGTSDGDILNLPVPKGVDSRKIRTKFGVDKQIDIHVNQLKDLSRRGKRGTRKWKDLERAYRSLKKRQDLLEEQDEAKRIGGGAAPKEKTDGSKRRRR